MAVSFWFEVGDTRSWLEGEAEHAEVVVETEDGRGATFGRGHGPDAVRERERQARVPLQQVPGARVELGVRVADEEPPRVDCLLQEPAKGERRVEARVVAQPSRRLGDDEVRREQDVACVPEPAVVLADPLVRTVAAPEQRDERAGVRVDDPQARSFGAP
jgi:hypothetical protein